MKCFCCRNYCKRQDNTHQALWAFDSCSSHRPQLHCKQILKLFFCGYNMMNLTVCSIQVCSPHLAHECDDNSYLNSVCYTMAFNLQHPSRFMPAFQGKRHLESANFSNIFTLLPYNSKMCFNKTFSHIFYRMHEKDSGSCLSF